MRNPSDDTRDEASVPHPPLASNFHLRGRECGGFASSFCRPLSDEPQLAEAWASPWARERGRRQWVPGEPGGTAKAAEPARLLTCQHRSRCPPGQTARGPRRGVDLIAAGSLPGLRANHSASEGEKTRSCGAAERCVVLRPPSNARVAERGEIPATISTHSKSDLFFFFLRLMHDSAVVVSHCPSPALPSARLAATVTRNWCPASVSGPSAAPPKRRGLRGPIVIRTPHIGSAPPPSGLARPAMARATRDQRAVRLCLIICGRGVSFSRAVSRCWSDSGCFPRQCRLDRDFVVI